MKFLLYASRPENEMVPTTKIEVKVQAEVNISRLEPKPGWTYELQKDASEKITSITWTSEGDGLSPTEFGQFLMQGKVDDQAQIDRLESLSNVSRRKCSRVGRCRGC